MESYVNKKSMEATWKLYEDDKDFLGCELFGMAISCWILSHKQEVQGFEEEYKINEKSA